MASKVTPGGSAPTSLNVGVGTPVAATVKVEATPTGKIVLAALVMAGAWLTMNVNDCVASGSTPLLAVISIA